MSRPWSDASPSSVRWDVGVALLCVLVFWLPIDAGRVPWAHLGLIAALILGMTLRSRWPLGAFAVVAAATLTGAALGVTQDPFVAAAWVLHRVALTRGTARSLNTVAVLTGVVIAGVAFLGAADAENAVRYTMLSLLALAGSWVLGGTTRRAALETEHAMLAERQGAVTAERLRVVREVHDVVSHSLGTIAVTAGVAARADDAVRMRDRLGQIETVSREALTELRTTLGAVRDSDEVAERRPQPGIDDLPDLAGRMRESGVAVTLHVTDAGAVPAGIGLAAYRIVQEGLTNAARHAPGARCTVTVGGAPGALRVTVTDDGRSAATPDEPGYGLVGLRERVELLGGTFSAGHRPGEGFELRAVLPLPEVADV
ncbi:Signal transduction histidine kinase [Nonomuraea solani]|uniref:histidine kinase n=1 Tax=Nonomuraea solani TaxID=1144553 RepID=A0A1H6CIA6_9ACTN|nr:histidine kinase [Nonomuraea solani]SEG72648.1 Signal transduction histidine kinase [Nonomuraea solani]